MYIYIEIYSFKGDVPLIVGRSTSSRLVVKLNLDELWRRSRFTWVGDVLPPVSRGFVDPDPARGAPPRPPPPLAYFFTPPTPPPPPPPPPTPPVVVVVVVVVPSTPPAPARLPGGARPPPLPPSFISRPPFDEYEDICRNRNVSRYSISHNIVAILFTSLLRLLFVMFTKCVSYCCCCLCWYCCCWCCCCPWRCNSLVFIDFSICSLIRTDKKNYSVREKNSRQGVIVLRLEWSLQRSDN